MTWRVFLMALCLALVAGCATEAKPEPKKNPKPQVKPGGTAAAPTEELQVNPAGQERGPGR